MAPKNIRRFAEQDLNAALKHMRGALIVGARQVGKSTLLREICSQTPKAVFKNLDDPAVLSLAQADPVTFVRSDGLLAIDEIQRAPELILPLKQRLDKNSERGQALLTGSAQVFALKSIPDTLPGRVATIELWPLSQAEIVGADGLIVEKLFSSDYKSIRSNLSTGEEVWQKVLVGGFPESVTLSDSKARRRFLQNYSNDTVLRGVTQISAIDYPDKMLELFEILASMNGQLFVPDRISRQIGMPTTTMNHYVALLELAFFIKRIPAWSNKATTRAGKSKKIAFVDSGVAAAKAGLDQEFDPINRAHGHLLETFVLMELERLFTQHDVGMALRHYRSRDGAEVDGIITRRGGKCVLVEVKASSSFSNDDVRHMRNLAEKMGEKFHAGVLFYMGEVAGSLGGGIWVLPISALWSN